jgi:subtilisin-like proprotein convertase family protein
VIGWEPPTALDYAATDTGSEDSPILRTDSAGTWIAVWQSESNIGGTLGDDWDILFSRSTDNGQTWSDAAPLNGNAASDTGDDSSVAIATDSAGNWIATWHSEDSLGATVGDDKDIFVARSTDNGLTWSHAVPLNSNASDDFGDDYHSEITADSAGHWIVTWYSYDTLDGTIGEDSDILFSTWTDTGHNWEDGSNWTDPQPLNANAASDVGNDLSPAIATDGVSSWVATWSSHDSLDDTIGDDRDILYSLSTNHGQDWSDPAPLNSNAYTDSGSDQLRQLVRDSAGRWIAVWNSGDSLDGTVGEDGDILFASSTDEGQTWSDPMPVNTNAATDSGSDSHPKLATDSAGNWMVVWHSKESLDGAIGEDFDILFSLSTNAGQTWTDPAPVGENDGYYDLCPSVATDSAGNWIVAWESTETLGDTVGSDGDIFFSRLTHFSAPVTYVSNNTPKIIRDGGWWWANKTESDLNISGTDDQVGSLVLDLSITHSDPTDLSGYLVSPAGTSVPLFDRQDAIPSKFYLSGDYYEESIDGPWTLEVWDHYRRDTGTINSWSLTVSAQLDNLPPEITSSPVTAATEDMAYSYDVDATDPDVGDTLTFSLDTAPAGMSINANSGLIEWTPNNEQVGENAVIVRVTDADSAYDTQSFSIDVANTNDNPVITSNPVLEAAEDSLYEYDVDANDPDVGDVLTFSLDAAPAGMTIDTSSGLIEWTPTGAQIGDQEVTVRVTDFEGLLDTQSFIVSVSEKNWPPEITSSAVETVLEDALYQYDVEATDPNGGQDLTFSLDAAPNGMMIDASTGLIQWSPDNSDVGDHQVTVRVEDPFAESDTQEFTLTVVNDNDAPSITSSPITAVTEGEAYSYDVNATDPDIGDTLTFSLDTAPAGMSINANSGLIEWTPENAQIGDNAVIVRVTDTGTPTAFATQDFTITVDAVSSGPNLSFGNTVSNGGWKTVTLPHNYTSMVIVASPNYDKNDAPAVVRIRNANGNSFEFAVQQTTNSANPTFVSGVPIHYTVMEEGVYDNPGDGYRLEAVKFNSTVTDENNSWSGESRSYGQSYSNPVVVGQVMSFNDPDWSVFWAAGGSRTSPPSSSALTVGKHVGEDSDTTRASETVGYFVIEATATAQIEGLPIAAGVSSDFVRGAENVTNSTGYEVDYGVAFNSKAAVVSNAGMDGGDGGWAVLYGNNPVAPGTGKVNVAVDEDQIRDSERRHTTEQVAYFVIDPPLAPAATAVDPLDTNGDRFVTALDALLVINGLHQAAADTSTLDQIGANGNGLLTPRDGLPVINQIHRDVPVGHAQSVASTRAWSDDVDLLFSSNEDDEEESSEDLVGVLLN